MTKSKQELQYMREGGKILKNILNILIENINTSRCGLDIEKLALKLCQKFQVMPAFLNYNSYPYATCISVNSTVVHGLPNSTKFKKDDLISIDFGIIHKKMNLDAARSICLNKKNNLNQKFINLTRESFYQAIKGVKAGSTVGDIGYQISCFARANNLTVLEDLCGHGIGKDLQEPPNVFNFGKKKSGHKLTQNMTIAIEPMFSLGSPKIILEKDKYSIKSIDGSLTAHWENTIIIGKNNVEVITE